MKKVQVNTMIDFPSNLQNNPATINFLLLIYNKK